VHAIECQEAAHASCYDDDSHPPAQVWEGAGVVASARKLIGATNPLASEPGTIRGDFAVEVGRNVVHGSDSPENGERETGGRVGG
jgi:nucleoside diphosphate kinase